MEGQLRDVCPLDIESMTYLIHQVCYSCTTRRFESGERRFDLIDLSMFNRSITEAPEPRDPDAVFVLVVQVSSFLSSRACSSRWIEGDE